MGLYIWRMVTFAGKDVLMYRFSYRIGLIVCLFSFFNISLFSKTYYVSSSIGRDDNPGNELMPKRSIDSIISKADTILLKAGDYFYGTYSLSKCYLGRYGVGPNPTLCGYKRIIHPRWKRIDRNVWRISLAENNYSGFSIIGSSLLNNIGCIHDYELDEIHGRKVQHYDELQSNWDFWQTDYYSTQMDPKLLDFLYLYLEEDPNSLLLEFSVGSRALAIRNATVESINIEGFGFGISVVLGGCIVRNCRIDAIGGMVLLSSRVYSLEGNGISLYFGDYSVKNCIIEGNYISRCYDCGLCVQGTGNGGSNASNIIFQDNLVTQCCQGLENFSASDSKVFEDCIAQHNFFINNGESGFGYPNDRFKRCQLLENNMRGRKGFKYKSNIFLGGNFYCVATKDPEDYQSSVFEDNSCYLANGQFIIGDYYGKKEVIRVLGSGFFSRIRNHKQISRFRELTADASTRFFIVNDRVIQKLSEHHLNRFLESHKY